MRKKLTIGEMRKSASRKGGRCLSKKYVNAKTKLKWMCFYKHIWKATPDDIKRGRWCPFCSKHTPLTFKNLRDEAKTHEGRVLSETYINSHTKYLWECKLKHRWYATFKNIRKGHWCPKCAGNKKLSIKEMQIMAEELGGKCLSEKYKNIHSKLKWVCRKGHVWWTSPNNIKNGKWCPECGRETARIKKIKYTIEDLQEFAKYRHGKCLSNIFETVDNRYLWECERGHRWKAKFANIKRGSWCPECKLKIGERICKAYFEEIFKRKFIKSRPKWLRNNDGNQMELDGYCHELKLAFEYQGRQHYNIRSNFFNKSISLSKKRQSDDEKKEILCRQNKIVLLQIPFQVKYSSLGKYIYKLCIKKGFRSEMVGSIEDIDYTKFDIYSNDLLDDMKERANVRGGRCLSDAYINSTTKLKWECSNGHVWMAPPIAITTGQWCLIYGNRLQALNLEEMQRLAGKYNGICLSKEYENTYTKLKWKCSKGHIFEKTGNAVQQGQWCKYCMKENKQKKQLEKIKKKVKQRKGIILTNAYIPGRKMSFGGVPLKLDKVFYS